MSRVKDMTDGKPAKLILSFALPLLLGNLFQQMYSMVDTMVVGRVNGVEALAAVGAASWLDWLVLGIVMGLTQGFGILMSQKFGAEDYKGLRKAVSMSVYLCVATAIIFTIGSVLIARPLLELLKTPDNAIDQSQRYIQIIFLGIPIILSYNMLSNILRALGDSKTPLYAMIFASIINIILDFVFVAGFGQGVAGVAIATLIAQACSCFYCLRAVRKIPILRLTKEDWKRDWNLVSRLLSLGLPVAFQNGIIAVGGLVVQYIVNGFGFLFVAGITAGNKLCGLMEMAGTSIGAAVATFAGQNLGAGEYKRIKKGVVAAVKISVSIAVAIAIFMLLFGKWMVKLFITGTPDVVENVVQVAYPYLAVMSIMLFVLYLLFVFRSTLQGMGDTIIPMVSGIVELFMRISMVLLLPTLIGETGVYLAEVSAWLGAEVLLMIAYFIKIRKITVGT